MVSTRSRRAAEEKENLPAGKKAKRLIPSSVKASPPKPLRFRGRYLLCNEPDQVEAACRALLKGGVRQVGFDMEWRVFFRKGPSNLGRTALLQLGFTAPPGGLDAGLSKLPWTFLDEKVKCESRNGGEHLCFLLHIHHTGLTPSLEEVLASTSITKYGVNIGPDVIKLERDFAGVKVAEAVDLCHLAAEDPATIARYGHKRMRFSLNDLSILFLGRPVDKDSRARLGNWEKPELEYEKKRYACTDAYITLLVAEALEAAAAVAKGVSGRCTLCKGG